MAIADAKRRKIGRELIDWIYLGIRIGARHSVKEFHSYKAADPALAEAHLLRAVNMPVRARQRINYRRDVYEAANGAGTFTTFISGCLTLAGTVTLGELNTALSALEADTATLKAMKAGGSTNDQIAAWIEANWQDETFDWAMPLPPSYTDSWL